MVRAHTPTRTHTRQALECLVAVRVVCVREREGSWGRRQTPTEMASTVLVLCCGMAAALLGGVRRGAPIAVRATVVPAHMGTGGVTPTERAAAPTPTRLAHTVFAWH